MYLSDRNFEGTDPSNSVPSNKLAIVFSQEEKADMIEGFERMLNTWAADKRPPDLLKILDQMKDTK